MKAVRRSLTFSVLDSYAGLVLQIASTVVIARILTPEETGVFAVAVVFATLASTFRDFGVAEYLIQEREVDDQTIRAALAVNIAISWIMAALLFTLSPFAASFYRSSGISEVMRLQSLNFVLIPFGAVTMAWFRRQMNFKPIFIAGLLANTASTVVAIVLALRGFSYMSLAWASLAGVIATVATSVCMRPKNFPWWPGIAGIKRVIHFGKFASGIYIFGQIGRGAPEMILGRARDMAAVGMFSRAYGLIEIFNRLILRSILPVCLPYFAKGVREAGTPLPALLTTTSYLTAVGWPFLAFMGIYAYAAIRIMYGSQWIEAVPLSQVLCLTAAVELIYYPTTEAMLALGRAREGNRLQMFIQGARIIGLFAAIPYGLPGACWGLLAAAAFGLLISYRYLARLLSLSAADLIRAVWPSFKVTILAISPLVLWVSWIPINESNYIVLGISGGIVFAILWLGAVAYLSHPVWLEIRSAADDSMKALLTRTPKDLG
jgi:O-antigen/teichoic acid export membrane protein